MQLLFRAPLNLALYRPVPGCDWKGPGSPKDLAPHLLRSYLDYYNEMCTHLSLDKDAPISRAVEAVGRTFGRPVTVDASSIFADLNLRQAQYITHMPECEFPTGTVAINLKRGRNHLVRAASCSYSLRT